MNILPDSLARTLTQTRQQDDALHLTRHAVSTLTDGVYVQQGDARYLSFCSNDYLGISSALACFPARDPAHGPEGPAGRDHRTDLMALI